MIKRFTCIICPNSCEITANTDGLNITEISGNNCIRGLTYVRNEISNPLRNFATSVLVKNSDIKLCSVRLTNPIPKDRIFDALDEIKKITVFAPVKIGDVLIKNILGLDSDVIATKNADLI